MNNEISKLYELLQSSFRPKIVKKLLVAECPPTSGKYFYLPKAKVKEISLSGTIFLHEFGKKPDFVDEYFMMLKELQKRGIFLIDILEYPLEVRKNKANRDIIIKEIGAL